MSQLVTTKKLSQLMGYSEEAIRTKVKKRKWIQNEHYYKAPDGRLMFAVEYIEKWIKGE